MWSGVWGRLTRHECLASHMLGNPRPVSDILLTCSRALGVADQGLKPDLFLSEQEQEAARALIPESFRGRRLIGIHPGSAGNACNLPSEVYGELAAQLLRETGCALIITGTSAEEKLLDCWSGEILKSGRVWNSMGRLDLRQLACVIAEMSVYVCSSTGPLHIASAVGGATVSPFCPEPPLNATLWGNVGGGVARVIEPKACPRTRSGVACCNFRGQISAARLAEEVQQILATEV